MSDAEESPWEGINFEIIIYNIVIIFHQSVLWYRCLYNMALAKDLFLKIKCIAVLLSLNRVFRFADLPDLYRDDMGYNYFIVDHDNTGNMPHSIIIIAIRVVICTK